MAAPTIVGVVLVRDEDLFVEQAVRNVACFCDELLLFDHRSRDRTPEILRRLAGELPHARFEQIDDPAISHERLLPYVGTDTWVIGVDGDELYDPASLPPMRARLAAREFDNYFIVKAMQLHCSELDRERELATGWLAPPSRSTTMLYNFGPLSAWEDRPPERLMGSGARFARPVEEFRWLRDEHPWDEAPVRCLHVCFLRRSSRQPVRQHARLSYVERIAGSRRATLCRRIAELARRPEESSWKLEKYRQGEQVTVSVAGFFPAAT
ncbi:MAG TPA: hypothetical protein VF101_15190 [Gaiellaceae bacterium]